MKFFFASFSSMSLIFISFDMAHFLIFQSSCCWANTTDNKYFKFSLSIETNLKRINSSPYPYIPASYYVDINHPQDIKVFASDLDGKNDFFEVKFRFIFDSR